MKTAGEAQAQVKGLDSDMDLAVIASPSADTEVALKMTINK